MNNKRIMMISTHGYVSLTPELGKPDTGGQVVYVLEVANHLARLGYKVDIFTRRFDHQPEIEETHNRNVIRIPCGGNGFIPKETLCSAIPEWIENAYQYIDQQELQYAFINSHYWDGGLAGQTLSRLLKIPHIHTPHSIGSWKRENMDGDPEEMERRYNFRHRIREEKVIYDECDALIVTTSQQRNILVNGEYDTPADKIHVIPAGYDDSRFYPVSLAERKKIRCKLKLEVNKKIILALGRMATNKGYDLLIRSMESILQKRTDIKLMLAIGSTEPSEKERKQVLELKQLCETLDISMQVIFSDYIPDDLLADYYRAADVFALSSRYEPFGMTAVEAMACGTPTVITTNGGLWEQLEWGRETIYEDPFHTEAFSHAIATVLNHPKVYDQLAKYGPRKARADFTWTGIVKQILQTVEKL